MSPADSQTELARQLTDDLASLARRLARRSGSAAGPVGPKLALAIAVVLALVVVASGYEDRPHQLTPTAVSAEAVVAKVPKIVALAPTFNYGKVKQGATVEHSFKIRNDGVGDLIIRRAKGS